MDIHKLRKKKEKWQIEGNLNNLYFACKDLADLFFRDEKYDKALKEYKEMLEISEAQGNKLDIARAHRMIGEVYCAKEDFCEAIKHQSIHLAISREENDPVEEQRALATLGRTHFLYSEVESLSMSKKEALKLANNYYLESLAVCDSLRDELVGAKQKMEMKARLFLNLGLVHDVEGNKEVSIDYLYKAVMICKKLDLWEDLYRTYCALASVYQHYDDSKGALANYDLAASVANRLPDKVQLMCDLLPLKAEVLLGLPDFRGARQCLLKAYKLRCPNEVVRLDIEKKLRTIAAMCECEEKLIDLAPEGDYQFRKNLYESIADMASSLSNFSLALTYYQLMLESVEKMGGEGKALIDCYVSLAQTYLDQDNPVKALEYFKKELALEKDNYPEACKTCLKIAECFEKLKKFDDMVKYYQQAKVLANKAGNSKLRNMTLKSMSVSLVNCGRQSFADNLPKIESDEEEDVEASEENTAEYGSHISLNDLSDEEGNEEFDRPKLTRTRQKCPKIKRNEKGETPLHTAAISGNRALVEKLLQQGHSVEVKDNSGWTPLHEACNHGFKEIVLLLINHGASVNDRGGPLCDGVTPLLDAASNGCLEIIEVLLNHGASPLMRTNKGESVVDCLAAWRERYIEEVGTDLAPSILNHYNKLYSRLKQTLEKAGQKVKDSSSAKIPVKKINQNSSEISGGSIKLKKSPEGSFKRITKKDIDLTSSGLRRGIEDKRVAECKEMFSDATSEYETAMKALRHRTKPDPVSSIAKVGFPALISEDDNVTDDWLEEDMRPSKKRKMGNLSLIGTSFKFRDDSPVSINTQDSEDSCSSEAYSNEPLSPRPSDLEMPSTSGSSSNRLKVLNSSRRKQISLMASGVTCEKVRKSNKLSPLDESEMEVKENPLQPEEAKEDSLNTNTSNFVCVKVRVEGKLLLIPIPGGNQEFNIGWLIKQAAARYNKLVGVEPVICLATDEGALLDEADPVCVVFGCKEVVAIVQSWKMDPLTSRYAQACRDMKTKTNNKLSLLLEQSQATGEVILKEQYLRSNQLEPLLKAICYHNTLHTLDLSGNNISDQTFKLVVDCVIKLPHLESLDISCCNVTTSSLSFLSQSVLQARALQGLKKLYIGFNPLQECLKDLSCLLSSLPCLKVLDIPCISLTSKEFRSSPQLTLESVECLNINDNELGLEGVQELLGRLDPKILRQLFLRRTGRYTVSSVALYLQANHPPALTHLDLSYCEATEHDILQLIMGLKVTINLEEVRLDGCGALSETAVKALLELPVALSLTGVLTSVDITSRMHSLSITSCSKQSLANCGPYGYQSFFF